MAKAYGRYKIIEEVGHGSMGVVYKAHDPVIGRMVALKVIRDFPWLTGEEREAYKSRFRLEAEAAGPLHHPRIVTLYDVGEGYLVMEFLEGQTLATLLRARQRLALKQVLHFCGQVADALDFAHTRGVVHRDLKPANIMVLPTGDVKVMDFGVARVRARESGLEGQVLGSAAYMAPEQLAGQRADGRSDTFSLGVIVYELLTGARPFPGTSETDIIQRIKTAPPRPVLDVNPALPPEYAGILRRALDKDPARRYPTSKEFIGALHLQRFEETGLEVLLGGPRDEVRAAAAPLVQSAPEPATATERTATAPPAQAAPPPSPPEAPVLHPGRGTGRRLLPLFGVAAALFAGVALWLAWSRGGAQRGPGPAPAAASPAPSPRSAGLPSAPPAPGESAPSVPEAAGGASGVLLVSSRPPGASVFLGGDYKGTTPLVLPDPLAGRALVRVELPGYLPATRLALIAPGRSLGLSVELQPENAPRQTVDILSLPDGGTLSINGDLVGKTNALRLQLPPGIHVVEVQKEGFAPWIREVEVGPGTDRVIATLERKAP